MVKVSMRLGLEKTHGFELPGLQAMIGAAVCAAAGSAYRLSYLSRIYTGTLSFCLLICSCFHPWIPFPLVALRSHAYPPHFILLCRPAFAIFSHISTIHMYFIRPFYHCSQYPLPALAKTSNSHLSISLYFSFESRLQLNQTPVIYRKN